MSQEDKDLLLKDLSARLPYGVKFLRESWIYEWDQELSVIEVLEGIDKDGYINNTKVYTVEDIKPYLRSMSSMTDEEYDELCECNKLIFIGESRKEIDWLNAHHFDYRYLIERGLAIEVTEENNPYELD